MNEDHHPVGRPSGESWIEAWLHVPTGNVFKDGDCQALIKLWHKQFPDIPADEMEADFVPLVRGEALLDRIMELTTTLYRAQEALGEYACHIGDKHPCIRLPDQCRAECGKAAGDAALLIDKALSGEKP